MTTESTTETPAGVIRLYRTDSKTKKPTKALVGSVLHELQLARVKRPDLTEFVLSGGFHRLTIVDQKIVKNAALRRRDYQDEQYCYTLTVADLGRATMGDTGAMSVRIWIEKYFVPAIIAAGEFSVVFDPE